MVIITVYVHVFNETEVQEQGCIKQNLEFTVKSNPQSLILPRLYTSGREPTQSNIGSRSVRSALSELGEKPEIPHWYLLAILSA